MRAKETEVQHRTVGPCDKQTDRQTNTDENATHIDSRVAYAVLFASLSA